MAISKAEFGKTKDNRQASLITISNKNGMRLSVTDFGATMVDLYAPDKNGSFADIIWGFGDVSGGKRHMQLFSNQPGLQMYSDNYLNGTEEGKGGVLYNSRSSLCLEPQVYPNGLNHSHFPSPVLKAGENYCYRSVYKFL